MEEYNEVEKEEGSVGEHSAKKGLESCPILSIRPTRKSLKVGQLQKCQFVP